MALEVFPWAEGSQSLLIQLEFSILGLCVGFALCALIRTLIFLAFVCGYLMAGWVLQKAVNPNSYSAVSVTRKTTSKCICIGQFS